MVPVGSDRNSQEELAGAEWLLMLRGGSPQVYPATSLCRPAIWFLAGVPRTIVPDSRLFTLALSAAILSAALITCGMACAAAEAMRPFSAVVSAAFFSFAAL